MRTVRAERLQRLDVFIDDARHLGRAGSKRQHLHHVLSQTTAWLNAECCWQDQSLLFDNSFGANNYDKKVNPDVGMNAQAQSLDRQTSHSNPASTQIQDPTQLSSTPSPSPPGRYGPRDRPSLDRRMREHMWGPDVLRLGVART